MNIFCRPVVPAVLQLNLTLKFLGFDMRPERCDDDLFHSDDKVQLFTLYPNKVSQTNNRIHSVILNLPAVNVNRYLDE